MNNQHTISLIIIAFKYNCFLWLLFFLTLSKTSTQVHSTRIECEDAHGPTKVQSMLGAKHLALFFCIFCVLIVVCMLNLWMFGVMLEKWTWYAFTYRGVLTLITWHDTLLALAQHYMDQVSSIISMHVHLTYNISSIHFGLLDKLCLFWNKHIFLMVFYFFHNNFFACHFLPKHLHIMIVCHHYVVWVMNQSLIKLQYVIHVKKKIWISKLQKPKPTNNYVLLNN